MVGKITASPARKASVSMADTSFAPYSSGWGYYPSGGLGLVLLILVILLLTGRL
jgi:hypothetical protein